MPIDRKALVRKHNPVLNSFKTDSPLTVGNGEFAFTADATGLQTFYSYYENDLPLCTQSQWGWHTEPVSAQRYAYTRDDLAMTPFDTYGRQVGYAKKKQPGNEEVYEWLRKNPHRLNLAAISFLIKNSAGEYAKPEDITNINQTLDLYSGILYSSFSAFGYDCKVRTCCHPQNDMVVVDAESALIEKGYMQIEIRFPYGSPAKSASDWSSEEKHSSSVVGGDENSICIKRTLDKDIYFAYIRCEDGAIAQAGTHAFLVKSGAGRIKAAFHFAQSQIPFKNESVESIFKKCGDYWNGYWNNGGILRLNNSSHPLAEELERRIILSQYLTAVQCSGSVPPQETGLTCNSWYGKFHLEMHYWHSAHFHFWNRTSQLERSMQWYIKHLDDARRLAQSQGYKGARWPKMVAENAVDSPSTIAPLLIWQQPHIICFLEYCYRSHPNRETLDKYREVMFETAEFMADYAYYDKQNDRYVLGPPVIPAQERHNAATCLNPTYELEYWIIGLKIACEWQERIGKKPNQKWMDVINKMAKPPVFNGVYIAQERCPETFEQVNIDHPSMLCAYGLLNSARIDRQTMSRTLDRVLNEWDYRSMWGWDFGVIAMTATLLGRPETAVEILLKASEKNTYVASGHNRQISRNDLPLYLPGNGSLLLAAAMMAAGYQGCEKFAPGFPDDGSWKVEFEDIRPLWL